MINNTHKYIYTKIGKTGSTSVASALTSVAQYEGNDFRHNGHYHLLDDIDNTTQNYFKFTFVRNPWARCVSRYFYIKQKKGKRTKNYRNSTFKEFILSQVPPYNKNDKRKFLLDYSWCRHSLNLQRIYEQSHPFENQLDWIIDKDGKILTDFIGRVENFQEDLDVVCDKIGIPRQKLPYRNKSKHKHYTNYYTDETKDIVAKIYAKDIKHFGYEFGK